MKLTLPTTQLLTPLSRILGAVDTEASIPILSHALIRTDGETLSVTGNNTEIEMTATAPCQAAPFAFCAPARKLSDILKSLPGSSEFSLSLTEQRLTITCGKSRFSISTLPAEQFPVFDVPDAAGTPLNLCPAELKDAMAKALTAAATEDVRYYLNGVYLEYLAGEGPNPWRASIAGSDGHRLALISIKAMSTRPLIGIIPRDAARELVKLLPETPGGMDIHITDRSLTAELPDLRFATKLIEGRYPDFRRVIPKDAAAEFEVDRAALLAAVKRTIILSGDHHGAEVALDGGELTLTAANAEAEQGADSITVDCDANLTTGFSLRYLADALGTIDTDNVAIAIADNGAASIRQPGDEHGIYVVMPMRIRTSGHCLPKAVDTSKA